MKLRAGDLGDTGGAFYGVVITDDVGVLEGFEVALAVAVGTVVLVGVTVGGFPVRVKVPEAFQPVPIKICTS